MVGVQKLINSMMVCSPPEHSLLTPWGLQNSPLEPDYRKMLF